MTTTTTDRPLDIEPAALFHVYALACHTTLRSGEEHDALLRLAEHLDRIEYQPPPDVAPVLTAVNADGSESIATAVSWSQLARATRDA